MSVQCRVRACTSFPRLPRARALTYRKERTSPSLSLAVSPLLCVYTSLSRSPFLSRYIRICCLSLLRVYVRICVYPLLRGSFSRRINLYVYKQPSAFRVRVRNALLPPTCVVTFGRSLARSQASPRAPLRAYIHTETTYRELEEETGRLSIGPCPWSSLTPCSCREKPFLSSDFSSSDYANFE